MTTTLQPMLEAPLLQEMTTELDTIPGVVIRQVHTVSLVCLLNMPARQCACSLLGHVPKATCFILTSTLQPFSQHSCMVPLHGAAAGGGTMQLVLAAAHGCREP